MRHSDISFGHPSGKIHSLGFHHISTQGFGTPSNLVDSSSVASASAVVSKLILFETGSAPSFREPFRDQAVLARLGPGGAVFAEVQIFPVNIAAAQA